MSPLQGGMCALIPKWLPFTFIGNNDLLPVFVYQKKGSESPEAGLPGTTDESLFVPLNGTLVDVRKLKDQNEKYEAERGVLEANLNALTNNMG